MRVSIRNGGRGDVMCLLPVLQLPALLSSDDIGFWCALIFLLYFLGSFFYAFYLTCLIFLIPYLPLACNRFLIRVGLLKVELGIYPAQLPTIFRLLTSTLLATLYLNNLPFDHHDACYLSSLYAHSPDFQQKLGDTHTWRSSHTQKEHGIAPATKS